MRGASFPLALAAGSPTQYRLSRHPPGHAAAAGASYRSPTTPPQRSRSRLMARRTPSSRPRSLGGLRLRWGREPRNAPLAIARFATVAVPIRYPPRMGSEFLPCRLPAFGVCRPARCRCVEPSPNDYLCGSVGCAVAGVFFRVALGGSAKFGNTSPAHKVRRNFQI